MPPTFVMQPIGWVRRTADFQDIDLDPAYLPALLGLEQYSHLWILYWFSENDNMRDRHILQVHPRRNPANPLMGVFATRSPVRPNLIGLCAVRLLKVEGLRLTVSGLDAREGTPVVDIKPYFPASDAFPDARTPRLLPHPRVGSPP